MNKRKRTRPKMLRSFLRENKMLVRIFLPLTTIVVSVMVAMTVMLIYNSRSLINHKAELTNYSIAQKSQTLWDAFFTETQTMGILLTQQKDVILFMHSSDVISATVLESLRSKLGMYYNVYDYIESIYIYSSVRGTVFSAGVYYNSLMATDVDLFVDNNWLEAAMAFKGYTTIIPRMRNNRYPFYLSTICRPFVNSKSVCVINTNIQKLGTRLDNMGDEYQSTFIISGGKVLYQKNLLKMPDDFGDVWLLDWLNSEAGRNTGVYEADGRRFAVAQVMSERFDWQYISVTDLQPQNQLIMQSQMRILLFMLIGALAAIGFTFALSVQIHRPIQSLQRLLDDPSSFDKRDIRHVRKLAERIMVMVNTNSLLQQELDKRLSLLQRLQVSALQVQINPHFLFNVLNVIQLTIVRDFGDEHCSSEMICDLSALLHYSLDGEMAVSLKEELEYAQIYIRLMERRYMGLFETVWSIDPLIENVQIPKLCLQPILENAIFYGLSPLEGKRHGILHISGRKENNSLVIQIKDNGCGIKSDQLARIRMQLNSEPMITSKHIGMRNVYSRIRLMYGTGYGLEISSEQGEGTTVTLSLPHGESR